MAEENPETKPAAKSLTIGAAATGLAVVIAGVASKYLESKGISAPVDVLSALLVSGAMHAVSIVGRLRAKKPIAGLLS